MAVTLEQLQDAFRKRVAQSAELMQLHQEIETGEATYETAHAYAIRLGQLLADAFGSELSAKVLPNGRMTRELAEALIRPMLGQNYELASEAAVEVQQALNRKAGIGLSVVKPQLNTSRIDGIIARLDSTEEFDDIQWILQEPAVNFTQSVVDDTVKANADAQYRTGLSPRVIRTLKGHGCKWCRSLAGVYAYEDVRFGSDVWRRHENCRCTVTFDPGDGKVQNAWTKRWTEDTNAAAIAQRQAAAVEDRAERRTSGDGISDAPDVLPEYRKNATPGVGQIAYEDGYNKKRHADEISMAQWLHSYFGGDIVMLQEVNRHGVPTPDYRWNGKLWDLKTVTTEKSANSAIRHGLKQIASNPGGIILNYEDHSISVAVLHDVIRKRLHWEADGTEADIMIVSKHKAIEILRYKK